MDKSIVTKSKNKAVATDMSIIEAIERQKPGFRDAVPKGFNGVKFARVCQTLVRESTALRQCSVQSLLGSMMVTAQLGLELDLNEAHIIPYGNKAQFQMGYRGLLKLAWNSGYVVSIEYDKICENDAYEYSKGDGGTLKHTPLLSGDRGNTIAYYAYALMKTGAKAVHLMTLKEVQDHGKRFSKAYNARTSPWKTDFDAMAYKTVLIQLADKKLPKATESLLAKSIRKDSTTNYIPKDKIGVAIDMDEIIDDTDYDEVKEPVEVKQEVKVAEEKFVPLGNQEKQPA